MTLVLNTLLVSPEVEQLLTPLARSISGCMRNV